MTDESAIQQHMKKLIKKSLREKKTPSEVRASDNSFPHDYVPLSSETDGLKQLILSLHARMDADRATSEADFSMKFRQLLDKVSEVLNETLSQTIELHVKREVKQIILQIKKAVADELLTATKTAARLSMDAQSPPDTLRSAFMQSVVPCIERCFQEMRIQMLAELKCLGEQKNVQTDRERVVALLEDGHPIEAAAIACVDQDSLVAFMMNSNDTTINALDGEMHTQLFERALDVLQVDGHIECSLKFMESLLLKIEIEGLTKERREQLAEALRRVLDIPEASRLFNYARFILRYLSSRTDS